MVASRNRPETPKPFPPGRPFVETSLKFQGSTERAPARSMGGFLDDVTALSVRFGIQPSVPLPAAIAAIDETV